MDGEADANDKTISIKPDAKSLGITDGTKTNRFSFDHAFGGDSSQSEVFEEVSQLVQSALDGYNICLFSYGQTGAGKTHTMQGTLTGEGRGIIPRSIEKIMEEVKRLEESDWKYTLECTFVEIYNETVRDLLKEKVADTENLQIKHDAQGNPYAAGANKIAISSMQDVEEVMKMSSKHRHVAHTLMNSRSSRSHSIFTLHIKGENLTKKHVLSGSLNLCDLAGSERISKSGAEGERLKEAQAINKSLSALADVFVSLSKKSSHVPYRNSKLTHILQQSFSARGKSMMFVNLSPAMESVAESICSLRFAEKVNQTELGRNIAKSITKMETSTSASSSSATTTKRTTATTKKGTTAKSNTTAKAPVKRTRSSGDKENAKKRVRN